MQVQVFGFSQTMQMSNKCPLSVLCSNNCIYLRLISNLTILQIKRSLDAIEAISNELMLSL